MNPSNSFNSLGWASPGAVASNDPNAVWNSGLNNYNTATNAVSGALGNPYNAPAPVNAAPFGGGTPVNNTGGDVLGGATSLAQQQANQAAATPPAGAAW